MTASAVLLAIAGCVVLVSASTPATATESSLVVHAAAEKSKTSHLKTADKDLDLLAVHILQHGNSMTEAKMAKLLQDWRNDPNTVMGTLRETAQATLMSKAGHKTPGGITMLAPVQDKQLSNMLEEQLREGARGDDALCGKRQLIIDKFDALLKKLGGEELSLKIELGQVTKEWKDSMEAYLNAESQFRLREEQAKEATDGAKFAEEEYEKWRTAHKAAKQDFKKNEENKEAELADLAAEEKMIKKIMRYIGVLHDVKATEKSIAAGGRDSKKDEKTGVSNPYDTSQKAVKTAKLAQLSSSSKIAKTKEELEDKINQLSALMSKSDMPGVKSKVALLAQKASLGKLAVYDESVEVVKILKELLDDIHTRREVLNKVDGSAKKLMDEAMNKMVEWETKLVALGNAKDKASAKAAAGADLKQKLNGEKTIAEKHKDEVAGAAKVEIPPFDREIYVITMIKKKVNEFCEAK